MTCVTGGVEFSEMAHRGFRFLQGRSERIPTETFRVGHGASGCNHVDSHKPHSRNRSHRHQYRRLQGNPGVS